MELVKIMHNVFVHG